MEPSAFEKEYMSRFNAQQRKAVRQVDGPILLLAVPGSGKTTVLVTRLLLEASRSGDGQSDMLAAAHELSLPSEITVVRKKKERVLVPSRVRRW